MMKWIAKLRYGWESWSEIKVAGIRYVSFVQNSQFNAKSSPRKLIYKDVQNHKAIAEAMWEKDRKQDEDYFQRRGIKSTNAELLERERNGETATTKYKPLTLEHQKQKYIRNFVRAVLLRQQSYEDFYAERKHGGPLESHEKEYTAEYEPMEPHHIEAKKRDEKRLEKMKTTQNSVENDS